jgi:histidyl-tRNA synthetase
VQKVGGPQDVRACGFAFGVDRLQALLMPIEEKTPIRVLIIPVSQQDLPYALQVSREVRGAGREAQLDVSGHGVSAGLRLAAKQSIRLAVIVGENERQTDTITLHNLVSGAERQVPHARFTQIFDERER